MPRIMACWKLRQKDGEFEPGVDYTSRPPLVGKKE